MKIINLCQTPTMQDALDTIDQLRKEVESGKLVSFFAAGVGDDDSSYAFIGSSRAVSRLRMIGAMTIALHMFLVGEV